MTTGRLLAGSRRSEKKLVGRRRLDGQAGHRLLECRTRNGFRGVTAIGSPDILTQLEQAVDDGRRGMVTSGQAVERREEARLVFLVRP